MKYLVLIFAAIMLSACGFTPMHAGPGAEQLQNLQVELLAGKDLGDEQAGFYVTQRLRDRVGTNVKAKHKLVLTPKTNRSAIGITDRDVATRYDRNLSMSYQLIEAKTGKVLDKGSVSSKTTYGAPRDPYGVVSADNNSKQQAAKEVADRMLNILAIYYAENPVAP